MKSKSSLKDMSRDDLDKKLAEYKLELAKQKGKTYMGIVPDNPGNIRKIKKSVARILTIRASSSNTKEAKATKGPK